MNLEQYQQQLEVMLEFMEMNIPGSLLKHIGRCSSTSKAEYETLYSRDFCLQVVGNMCFLATLHLMNLMDSITLSRYETIVDRFSTCLPTLQEQGFQIPPQLEESIAIVRKGPP